MEKEESKAAQLRPANLKLHNRLQDQNEQSEERSPQGSDDFDDNDESEPDSPAPDSPVKSHVVKSSTLPLAKGSIETQAFPQKQPLSSNVIVSSKKERLTASTDVGDDSYSPHDVVEKMLLRRDRKIPGSVFKPHAEEIVLL